MGKQCSCLSTPKENTPIRSSHPNITNGINTQSRNRELYDDSFSQQIEEIDIGKKTDNQYIEDQHEMAKSLTNGYIRSSSINLNDTEIISITKLIKTYYYSDIPMIRKRCVFLSIYSLNLCIEQIPKYILDDAIFCFKANRSQLFWTMISCDGISSASNSSTSRSSTKSFTYNPLSLSVSSSTHFHPLFIKYCIEKSNNGLLLLMEDNKTWKDLSSKLSVITDTFYGNKTYNPLKIDIESNWNNNNNLKLIYNTNINDVINELKENNLKFFPSMEIIKQSNPTLIPMKSFDIERYLFINGCNSEMIWTDNNKYDINNNKYEYQQDESYQSQDENEQEMVYCVDQNEFIVSDCDNDDISINTDIDEDILAGFDDNSSFSD